MPDIDQISLPGSASAAEVKRGGDANCRLVPAGDTALVVEFGRSIDRDINARVLALAKRLNARRLNGLVELVPTFRSLMVYYDPLVLPAASLVARITEALEDLPITHTAGRAWSLPVCYHPDLAPDLAQVAAESGLAPAQVVERHRSIDYHVYMVGFLPGCPYLGDLAAELALPRRPTPRRRIPAGSLVIANRMTSIVPLDTPNGWHIIGRCPVPLLDRHVEPMPLLASGDKVTFAPVSLREFEELAERAAAGTLRLQPIETFEAAA
jgi:KipI family sensor histidine kinase inhibitor